jgi:5-methylcytosine-specific restriction endonuclease McrA
MSAARYTDLEIFKRDDWRCHICHRKVRRDVSRTHRDGATIDHLVPLSLGGTDEPNNVATAHYKCNIAKRAMSANDQLALI